MKHKARLTTAALLAAVTVAPTTANAEISANISIQSDYVWRGVSQNDEDPSFQAGVDYGHESGFYVGAWGAMVDFGGPEDAELDLYAGWSTELDNGLGLDIGVIEYTYLGGSGASDANFTEYYLGLSYAGFGLTYYVGDEFDDNVELSYGYEFDSGLSVGATYGDYDSYNFYQVGVSGSFDEGIGWDVSYWDTDIDNDELADGRVVFTLSIEF